jgi:hypothetical protein
MDDVAANTFLQSSVRDKTGFDAIEALIERFPNEPMTFYLRRLIAQSYMLPPRGMTREDDRGIDLLKTLEQQSHGLRRRELQMMRLRAYGWPHGTESDQERVDAEKLIDELTSNDVSIWTNKGFFLPAFSIRLADPYVGAGWAEGWWMQKMSKDGPQPPTWDELREVAATAPPRRPEPMGPFKPRSTTKYRHHILR